MTELVVGVSEEADSSAASGSVLAELGPVTGGVEPAFEDAVSEVAGVTSVADSIAKLRARGAGIVVLVRVSPASLLAGMGVGTLCPVVGPATPAVPHLELEHSELIRGENVDGHVEIFSAGCVRVRVVGNETVETVTVGECSYVVLSCVPIGDLKVWDLDHRFGINVRVNGAVESGV